MKLKFHLALLALGLIPLALCPAGTVQLSADSFTLTFDAEGRPAAAHRKADSAEFLRPGNGGPGFYLKAPGGETVPLKKLALQPDGQLSVRSDDGAKEIIFQVTPGSRSLSLRIQSVTGIPPENVEELHFDMNSDSRLRALDLDYMTQADNWDYGVRVAWPAFWHRSPQDPLGGFVLYEKNGDEDEDATLLQLWVNEKLPHPHMDGEWTLARARQWVTDWQHRFADRGQLILAGQSLAELRDGVEFAKRAGLKQIYLFTDTWRTDAFWPETDLNWAVNRKVFPRGETDLGGFSDYVRRQGMYLALHYVSGGIGWRDPVYVGQKPDRRFASWGNGSLAHEVSATDSTLVFQPATGVLPPAQHRPAYPHFFEFNVLRVGDELVRFGKLEVRPDGNWVLSQCQRGQGSTRSVAHVSGEEASGLLAAYGANLVPDNDSSLLDEVATNYAGLLNRCLIEHAEFDGAEIHAQEGRWGYLKFATRIYETLDHPTTSHDSGGRHPLAWFEYRLNSSKRLMRGSCAYTHGNYSVPVTLYTVSRPATTWLDAQFTLSQGHYGGALGICKPEPMFGVTPEVLKTHGLTEPLIEALKTWREIDALLTEDQHQQINQLFTQPDGLHAQFNRHLCSPVVPVAQKLDRQHYAIVPTRVLTRAEGDILWQHGQEFGSIAPRQFLKLGETVTLQNPDPAQEPGFDPLSKANLASVGHGQKKQTDTDVFTMGNESGSVNNLTNPAENILLMPVKAKIAPGEGWTHAQMEGEALVLTATNSAARVERQTDKLPSWNLSVDMSRRRGLGLWVTGDYSGALLLVKLAHRDYVIPVDFTGRKYIEIPNGEVSWARGDWGWRMDTKSAQYARVGTVEIGIAQLPARGQTMVKVEQMTALGEIAVPLDHPVLHLGSGELEVKGVVNCGQFLRYSGGSHARLYDENWHEQGQLKVKRRDFTLPTGPLMATISAAPSLIVPWIDLQIITTNAPIVVIAKP